ncbi:MAG TPA: hypothetical protein VJY34_07525 [Roseiarcus sp.]|nr:hypothetical protein [Roseiarcus sp.]
MQKYDLDWRPIFDNAQERPGMLKDASGNAPIVCISFHFLFRIETFQTLVRRIAGTPLPSAEARQPIQEIHRLFNSAVMKSASTFEL